MQWLTVPHASARERLFALAPLEDLAPDLVPPGWDETVAEARARAEGAEGPGAVSAVRAVGHLGSRLRWLDRRVNVTDLRVLFDHLYWMRDRVLAATAAPAVRVRRPGDADPP